MKMKILYFTICVSILHSCKENVKSDNTTSGQDSSSIVINKSANIDAFYPMLNQMDLSTMEVAAYRKSATDIVYHRNKELGNKVFTILVKDSWKYEGIFKGSSFIQPDSLEMKWIKFKDNLMYDYGQGTTIKGKGIYTYNYDSGLLLLVDNDIAIKPHEYNVKIHNDMIILEGQSTYEDNNIQAKLVRVPDPMK